MNPVYVEEGCIVLLGCAGVEETKFGTYPLAFTHCEWVAYLGKLLTIQTVTPFCNSLYLVGDTLAIDGTDGDVMLGVDMEGLQLIKATKTVDGKETNLIGIGLLPAYWQNVASKRLVKFAITPVETVNCKLEGDVRSQAHCVYNKSAIGEFKTPQGIFKSSYKTSGGGYPSQYVSCVDSMAIR